ncbi:hypothetical protein JOF41_003473 [Saccharothrix coeruleofusca]|uniref:LysR substrate-binding domain-containing protein n=1 Tax=Saccharothrix coeruleofusca TaxID=33919 RepID=UPI001AE9806F|nr:LysR substrate-binding domain-containing protein [Saccharothrix coeruleofusca]MBP2337295.1 hypothetical protein [Saccharothrix coeruleofusca]
MTSDLLESAVELVAAPLLESVGRRGRSHHPARFRRPRHGALDPPVPAGLALSVEGHGLRSLIDQALRTAGVEPAITCQTNSMLVRKKLVATTDVCSVLPAASIAENVAAGRVTGARLTDPEVSRDVLLALRRGSRVPPAVEVVAVEVVRAMHRQSELTERGDPKSSSRALMGSRHSTTALRGIGADATNCPDGLVGRRGSAGRPESRAAIRCDRSPRLTCTDARNSAAVGRTGGAGATRGRLARRHGGSAGRFSAEG